MNLFSRFFLVVKDIFLLWVDEVGGAPPETLLTKAHHKLLQIVHDFHVIFGPTVLFFCVIGQIR